MSMYSKNDFKGVKVQDSPSMIIIHNSGSDKDTALSIVHYHRSKWSGVGYHWLIEKGRIIAGRPTLFVGAHSSGENNGSIGFCVVGNYMEKLPDEETLAALVRIISIECFANNIPVEKIIGHREVGNTDCPGDKLFEFIPEIRKRVKSKLKERNNDTKERIRKPRTKTKKGKESK
ncbi:MAG: N-acetylmuramoyl-L-alanine amidase [Nanoarchaeota archaeon]|nr:N-acetylmuramoyl-L-alanine amidase [Nanoarchaeota archaeon]